MSLKLYDWSEDQDTELSIQSTVGINLEELERQEHDRQLGLARAEALAAHAGAGKELLRNIAAAMAIHRDDDPAKFFSIRDLDESSRILLSEVLGRGEVSGRVGEPSSVQIQESVFPGLWRVKSETKPDEPECLVIADVPPMLRLPDHHALDDTMHIREDADGVMNALPVLGEIRERAKAYIPGRDNHIINFTLLPMSEADMALMRETLGAGQVDLVSKGYGKCRVCSTRWPHVWSVQFFNAMDTIILDSLEVGDVPVSVRAAGDDFVDSSVRLLEIIEAYL